MSGFEDSFGVYESMNVSLSPEWHTVELEFQDSTIYLKAKINFEVPNPFDANQLVAVV